MRGPRYTEREAVDYKSEFYEFICEHETEQAFVFRHKPASTGVGCFKVPSIRVIGKKIGKVVSEFARKVRTKHIKSEMRARE